MAEKEDCQLKPRCFRPFPDVNEFPRGNGNPSLRRTVYVVATDTPPGIRRPCTMNGDCPEESDPPDCP